MFVSLSKNKFTLCGKTRKQVFLLVSVRHVGAHPDELQHGVSIQSSINLGKTFLRISRIRVIPSTQILGRVSFHFRCRKSWAYLRKNPDYAPAKAWNWTTGVLTKRPQLSSWSRITHDWMKTPRSFQRKKGVTTVVSGRSVKCNAIFAVYDLSAHGFKGAVSRNSAKLGNYKMPVKLREIWK